MSDAALGTTGDPVTISTEQVELLSVAGRLNGDGLRRLQRRLDELLDAGARLLVADLSGVSGVDGRLVDLLARTDQLLRRRGGWLRLVGLGSSVMKAPDQTPISEVLLVNRDSGWASHGAC